MELRAVLLFSVGPVGFYILQGYYTDGTQTDRFVGASGTLSQVASQGQMLANHSDGGITYNSTDHTPF